MNETTMINQENNVVNIPQQPVENVVIANNATATTDMQQNEEIVAYQQPVEEVVVKPYTFNKFKAPDVFPMIKILGKIGINEFAKCLGKDNIKEVIESFSGKSKDEMVASVGISVFLEAANVIICNLPKCENDIYNILSNTSNLSVEEIKDLDLVVFTEMIIDYVQRDDFKDFIKVVSRLLK